MSGKQPVASEFARELNLFHLTMMGLGMMIGAGVFIGIGITLGEAGPGGVMLTFALNGLIAVFTAMSWTPGMRSLIILLTALQPPPPTPTTSIGGRPSRCSLVVKPASFPL